MTLTSPEWNIPIRKDVAGAALCSAATSFASTIRSSLVKMVKDKATVTSYVYFFPELNSGQ